MIPKGQLTVAGTIDFSQFWPSTKGTLSSDGDTLHLKVDPLTSFLFSASPKTKPKVTRAYVGAFVIDGKKRPKVITAKSEIKIRLQGIDTPELHYPVIATRDPSKVAAAKADFRQAFGASAASALHDHLKGLMGATGGTIIHATFVTRIDRLRDAIDSHGRFVGDVLVGTSAGSINTWLVEQGWAFPLFYDSMTDVEIRTLLAAWKIGKARGGRPGKNFKKPLLPFDAARNINTAKLPDSGGVNYPKIFRRQATFWTKVPGPLPGSQFKQLLEQQGVPKKPDKAYLTNYFLSHIKKLDPKKRVTLASQIGAQGQTNFKPESLVFQEDASRLFAADGTEIKN